MNIEYYKHVLLTYLKNSLLTAKSFFFNEYQLFSQTLSLVCSYDHKIEITSINLFEQ